MKKLFFTGLIFIFMKAVFCQEAIKSTQEEYYDFLSLQGITEKPYLGYRTLSDSEWSFINKEHHLFDKGNNHFSDTTIEADSENKEKKHPWKENNLGNKITLWQKEKKIDNWFLNGINQNVKLKIYGPVWFNSYNTASPYGQNDGALWQGKGYNTSLSAGARLEAFGFELTIRPQISFSENKEFKTLGNVYGNNYGIFFSNNIDLVERYGDKSLLTFDWKDTEIRWTWHTLTFGIGWQSPWLGGSWLNPMLGSNNASPYPKIDAGLRKTEVIIPFCNWYLGDIEGRIWIGKLSESDYFLKNLDYSERMLTAMSASYSPSFIPGFTIGLNRIFMTKWKIENFQYIGRLFTASKGNATGTGNDEDQKIAFFARWIFPKVGFELFGEFGRDDFSSNEDTNPFHTAIYTIGAKQFIPIALRTLFPKWQNAQDFDSELIFEWNNFEMSQDFQLQWPYLGYYAHHAISHGYTNKGELIGAGSGGLGNSQYIGWKIFYPKGSSMLFFHRYCPNNNSVYSKAVKTASDAINGEIYKKWYANFETYFIIGINTSYFVTKSCNSFIEGSFIKIYKYHYEEDSLINFNIRLGMEYNF